MAILAECHEMSDVYFESSLGNEQVKKLISKIKEKIHRLVEEYATEFDLSSLVLNNTEVNSSNFLFDESSNTIKLVDWEKAVFSVPTQDLSHFLVPTTTLWKTDYRFSNEEVDAFIKEYCSYTEVACSTIREQLRVFWPLTCLRGISWCAMAYTEYMRPERPLKSEYTFKKIKMYTNPDFIANIFNEILRN